MSCAYSFTKQKPRRCVGGAVVLNIGKPSAATGFPRRKNPAAETSASFDAGCGVAEHEPEAKESAAARQRIWINAPASFETALRASPG